MVGFFYICEYLGVTPQAFFDEHLSEPQQSAELLQAIDRLDHRHREHILRLIEDLLE